MVPEEFTVKVKKIVPTTKLVGMKRSVVTDDNKEPLVNKKKRTENKTLRKPLGFVESKKKNPPRSKRAAK